MAEHCNHIRLFLCDVVLLSGLLISLFSFFSIYLSPTTVKYVILLLLSCFAGLYSYIITVLFEFFGIIVITSQFTLLI